MNNCLELFGKTPPWISGIRLSFCQPSFHFRSTPRVFWALLAFFNPTTTTKGVFQPCLFRALRNHQETTRSHRKTLRDHRKLLQETLVNSLLQESTSFTSKAPTFFGSQAVWVSCCAARLKSVAAVGCLKGQSSRRSGLQAGPPSS